MDRRLAHRAGLRGCERHRNRAAVLHFQHVPDPDDHRSGDRAERCRADPVADRHRRARRPGDWAVDRSVRISRGLRNVLVDPGRSRAGPGTVDQRVLVTCSYDIGRRVYWRGQLLRRPYPADQRSFPHVSRPSAGAGRDRRVADHDPGPAAAAAGDCRELALGLSDAGRSVRTNRPARSAAANAAPDRQPPGPARAEQTAARLELSADSRFLAAGLRQHDRRDHYWRRDQPARPDDRRARSVCSDRGLGGFGLCRRAIRRQAGRRLSARPV